MKSSGEITYEVPEKIEVFCALDVKKFPFDHQICKMYLVSWMYTSRQLVVIPSNGNGTEFMKDNAGLSYCFIQSQEYLDSYDS